MIRKIINIIRLLFVALDTIFFAIVSFTISGILRQKHLYHPLSRAWSKSLLFFSGVKVVIESDWEIKLVDSFIYVSNHASLYDIPILIGNLPTDTGIIYKKELNKVPFMGWSLAVSPYIAINRSDARDSFASLENAIEAIKKGDSVIVFPEGTRSPDGKIQSFKRGAFVLAARSGKPIVPITIVGSADIMPKGSFNFSRKPVRMIIHRPVTLEEIGSLNEKKLMESVYQTVASALE
jgi:1-acyl-sn-glycerol-3-phosphate acyltransferase